MAAERPQINGLSRRGRIGFRVAEGTVGVISVLYAISSIDAVANSEGKIAKEQAIGAGQTAVITAGIKAFEWILSSRKSS